MVRITFDDGDPEICVRKADRVTDETRVPAGISHRDVYQYQLIGVAVRLRVIL